MSQAQFLADRLKEVCLDGKFIANTNIKSQIKNITWLQANQKIESLNTIALLTYHLNYYLKGILNFTKTGTLEIKDQYSFDMPSISCENEWKALIHDFIQNSEEFIAWLTTLTDEQLQETFVHESYGTYKRNIMAVIEHSYYHFGQISLIRKLITSKESSL